MLRRAQHARIFISHFSQSPLVLTCRRTPTEFSNILIELDLSTAFRSLRATSTLRRRRGLRRAPRGNCVPLRPVCRVAHRPAPRQAASRFACVSSATHAHRNRRPFPTFPTLCKRLQAPSKSSRSPLLLPWTAPTNPWLPAHRLSLRLDGP